MPNFQEFMGKDGKLDEEKLKEYFKKMNVTYEQGSAKKEGEEAAQEDITGNKSEVKYCDKKRFL